MNIYTAFIITMARADGVAKQAMMETFRVPQHLVEMMHTEYSRVYFQAFFQPASGFDVSLGNRIIIQQQVDLLVPTR